MNSPEPDTNNIVRKNGFQRPFEPLQAMTWLLLCSMIIVFYGLIIPQSGLAVQAALGVVYGVLVLISVWSGFVACATDPADDNVLQRMSDINGTTAAPTDNIYCRLCSTHVNRSSKHCRYCEKCVDGFDHHCKWLNNCIGKKNYRYFLILLSSTFSFTLLELALFVVNMVQYLVEHNTYAAKVERNYPSGTSPLALFVVNWIFIGLLLPVAGLLGQLFFFHAMLIHHGLTTYDYIIQEQARDRERNELAIKRNE